MSINNDTVIDTGYRPLVIVTKQSVGLAPFFRPRDGLERRFDTPVFQAAEDGTKPKSTFTLRGLA
ncbi:hypothetical protein [Paraburkholderia sp. RL17-347-BIC-D]|jgi:hypothetical protein|uniref:hypothetical protein n=1 Tax=Paraburkholderia sp. RL17-347-BIC-D TaxID=3031632 RepID=UPI0038BA83EA